MRLPCALLRYYSLQHSTRFYSHGCESGWVYITKRLQYVETFSTSTCSLFSTSPHFSIPPRTLHIKQLAVGKAESTSKVS